jgi:dipeptidyl aminopeptidase/acylaminoacyl peptidase
MSPVRPSRARAIAPALLAALALIAAPALVIGQPRQLTDADYARAERMLGQFTTPLMHGTAGRATWLADGRFWYRVSTVAGGDYILVNPARRTREPAFDHARLATALGAASGTAVNAAALQVQELDPAARSVTATAGARTFRCDLGAYTCAPAPAPAATRQAPPRNSSVSPDGSRAVFIRDHNLWVKDLATGTERAITSDGLDGFGYATNNAGWVHNDNPVISWSPDGSRLATFQHDGRGVDNMYLVSTNVGSPRLQAWRYPLPGDSVIFRIHRIVVSFDAAGAPSVTRLQMPPDAHRSTVSDHIACGGALCDLQWVNGASQLAFISSSRDHKEAWLRVADPVSGGVRTVLYEQSATHIGDASHPSDLWRVLPASNEVIWWSDKDDFTNLYLHDLTTGAVKNRITPRDGNVTSVVRIDEKARRIWFTAVGKETGRDPYFAHFYRVNFDGTGLTLLTPDSAHHTVQLSPDGRWFTDTYSTPVTPPVTVLRDAMTGRLVRELERADISRLLATGWKPPMPVTMKARDGQTDIYGLLYTPSSLDSSRKYPIINYIYPGPQSGSVGSRGFSPARSDHQALAELGFVVVAIDGMGTPGRSKTFRDFYYGRMFDNTIPDQVAGMQELARRYRFIDIDKAGMWGHSGGGFATASAMFQAPDFFKVGISESGNHDQRNYEDDWGERYQGLLVRSGDSDNYAEQANQTHAGKLKGKLFLIHGMMDDNVPPYNTLLVVDALMKANKDFDLIMLPQARHGFGADGAYIMRRRWDYFVQHLQGNVPPKEYQMGRQRPGQ